ncbi:MAG TPA: sulfotransferase [Acidimicrobiales bacterium]|nr:sulfotransferase [Acidimicrobiales bacterium]
MAAKVFNRLPATTRRSILHRWGRFAPWEEGFDFTPPALGPGEVPGPPDFVGIGVQKAGTTWWYGLVASHPGVSARPDVHKERHYLSRYGTARFGPADIAGYHGWFPRTPGTLAGEWTPDYIAYPWVAPLLARAAPEARLLVMVRDPVERFRSGLVHELRNGAPPGAATTAQAIERGFYHRALSSWWDHFDEAALLVLQYERCVADPAGELATTYRFLGLDDGHRPVGLDRPVSVTEDDKIDLDDEVRARLADLYAPDVARLAGRVDHLDLSLWVNFAGTATTS